MSAIRPKRPRDPNKLAWQIVQEATGQAEAQPDPDASKDKAAVELGRKGGKATAERRSPEARKLAAQKAIAARWKNR